MRRTWALGCLCVFVSCFLIGYNIQTQKKVTLIDYKNHTVTYVHYLSMDVERTLYGLYQTFSGVENLLSVISHSNDTIPKQDIQNALNRLVADNPFMTSLMVLDAEGKPLHRNAQSLQRNLELTDYFSIHKTHHVKNLYIGRPFVSKHQQGQWMFGVSKGLRDTEGRLLSVMVATIDIKYMQQRYQGAQLHSDAMMTLSSLDGYIYTRLPEQRTLLGKHVKNYVKPANTENKTIVTRETSPSRKISNIVISRRIGPYPLVVSISVPESSLLMTWHQSVMQFIILGVVVSGMILYLTHRVARYQNKQREIKIELKNQATTDPLTGLTNRRYVLEQAAHEIKKARRTGAPLSFILMDLDHFKVVNDSYGHDIGDKVLRKTANILKNMCREADIVSRYGGEEFLLVLPDTDMDGALVDAERVRKTLAETSYRHSKKTFTVTASFGVSQWAEYENDHTEAMRRADKALYKVKNLGRNDVDFQATASVTPLRARKKIVCNKSEE